VAQQQPPGGERPLLIDPAREDPVRHIQFLPIIKNGKRQWIPTPRKGSVRGLNTIDVLRLDRPDLLDLFEDHVDQYVMPAIGRVRSAIAAASPAATVKREWRDHILPLVRRVRPYAALSYDVIDHEVVRRDRRTWGLRLSRPR